MCDNDGRNYLFGGRYGYTKTILTTIRSMRIYRFSSRILFHPFSNSGTYSHTLGHSCNLCATCEPFISDEEHGKG